MEEGMRVGEGEPSLDFLQDEMRRQSESGEGGAAGVLSWSHSVISQWVATASPPPPPSPVQVARMLATWTHSVDVYSSVFVCECVYTRVFILTLLETEAVSPWPLIGLSRLVAPPTPRLTAPSPLHPPTCQAPGRGSADLNV